MRYDPLVFMDIVMEDKYKPKEYNKQLFDDSYWNVIDAEISIQSWFPFFSSCRGYDRMIQLFDVLEDEDQCTLMNKEGILKLSVIP